MIRIFGWVILSAADVYEIHRKVDGAVAEAMQAKADASHYMMYCQKMFLFIMRNLPLKRKRKALRRMMGEASVLGKEGGRR